MVLIFVLSIMFLIIRPNIISILKGWDGLGLVSYCLVIYYQNVKSYNGGILTVLSNRIGDVALLIVIAWILNTAKSLVVSVSDLINRMSREEIAENRIGTFHSMWILGYRLQFWVQFPAG
jgi:NADH:ubiquinone oxidoreductase subunit 5 (subunit L)/multisubunit Na+/H+ antiporter MnhA subunit